MDQKTSSLISLDNLIKLIPAAFLYFGFVYLDNYFGYFNINIASFYGFDEFIVIFLPIIDILIPFALVLLLLWSFIYFNSHKDLLNIRTLDLRFDPKRFDQLIDKATPKKERWAAVYYMVANMTVIYFVAFWVLNRKVQQSTGYDRLFLSLFSGFFLALSIYDGLKLIKEKYPKLRLSVSSVSFTMYLLIFWGFTKGLGKENAKSTLTQKNSVSFQYEGAHYQTSKDTIVIGDTKRYIILRSIKESTNLFFERDKISSLQTRK
jgi:hypothetical protein